MYVRKYTNSYSYVQLEKFTVYTCPKYRNYVKIDISETQILEALGNIA